MISYSEPFLLSDTGSDRATAYVWGNKSVTLGDKTHVFWTDAIARTMARTYDPAAGAWSDGVFIGDGTDNHNSPSVTADAEGRLRVAYGPHGPWDQVHRPLTWPSGRFRYTIADAPNSLKGLDQINDAVGFNATYAYLLHTTAGIDCIAYRGGEEPYQLVFQRQASRGGWENPVFLMKQDIVPQYTWYGPNMACHADGTLYAAGCFYGLERKASLGCAILRSPDYGETWTDIAGEAVDPPIEYHERFAVPHGPAEFDPRLQGLGLDPDGRVWATTVTTYPKCSDGAVLSRWNGSAWESFDLNPHLPDGRQIFSAPMCVDTKGRVHIFVSAYCPSQLPSRDEAGFGHVSLRVYHMVTSDAGATFTCNEIGESVPGVPNWQPTISQQGPYHPVENPVLLYTTGTKTPDSEERCRSTHHTRVYCVRVQTK